MKALIDSLDGQGYIDFTPWIAASKPLVIERRLNAPSRCAMGVYLQSGAASVPALRGRMIVIAEDETELFSGYVTSVTSESDAAEACTLVVGLSDEAFADAVGEQAALHIMNGSLQACVQRVVSQQGAGLVDASGVLSSENVAVAQGAALLSENLGALAEAGYSAYRVLGGALGVQKIGETAHALEDVLSTSWKPARDTANDVTVCGEIEPATFVTEVFRADGTTAAFDLAHAPFRRDEVLLDDSFASATLDGRTWAATDPASALAAGGAGLVMNGGDGADGHTVLQLFDDVELGGPLTAEAVDVRLHGASEGILCGVFDGGFDVVHCVAGIRVRQTSGVTVALALVNGAEAGDAFVVQEGHRYTFRVRMMAAEMLRVKQSYRATVNSVVTSFGGGVTDSPMRVVCEVQDLGLASNTAATVLCHASIASVPAVTKFAAVSCAQMFGSIRSVRLMRWPAAWLTVRDVDGVERPVLLGDRGEGVDASLSAAGAISFFDGRVPAAGENVVAEYFIASRAVARMENADAIAEGDALGLPGRARWYGRVTKPKARCTEDCEQAAAALLAIAGDATSALHGVTVAANPQKQADVWPGDAVGVHGQSALVRGVTVRDTNSDPELLLYEMTFANEWPEPLAIHTTDGLAAGVRAPDVALAGVSSPLESLRGLKVVAVTETAIQMDAGVDPPTGGGFEVRRWDAGFGATDTDLVLRSAVRGFDIPREMQQEMYYVRMYDGSTPVKYSRFSSAVRVTVPMG